MQGRAIDHARINIPNDRIDDALAFYRDVLGFSPEMLDEYRNGDRTIFSFRIADTALLHVCPTEPSEFAEPTGDSYDHFAIVLDAGIDEIRETIENAGIDIRRTGNPLGATGRNPAIYVEDPFGYVLELKAGQ